MTWIRKNNPKQTKLREYFFNKTHNRMKFIENNIIDKAIKDFDKKNRFLGAYIRLKINYKLK